MRLGFVVTPSSRPVSASSRISEISAVSAKNFMGFACAPALVEWISSLGHSRWDSARHPIQEKWPMSEHVTVERNDAVLAITLARPERRNAITVAMYAALADAIESVAADPAVRAITIRGEGQDFAAGNDLADFLNALPRDTDEIPVWRLLRALAT